MSRKVEKKRSAARSSARAGRPLAYLIGESPLVEEYAELCASRNYEVVVSWNPNSTPQGKPRLKQVRISANAPAKTSVALELTNTDIEHKKRNIQKLDRALGPDVAIISTSVTITATEQATLVRHRHRVVGFGALPGFSDRPLVELAPTVHTPMETISVVRTFFQSLGKEIEVVQDRIGLVLPRILCQIINEATFAVMEDVASPRDIDVAMKLGVNYPLGPIEWAERIGIRQVYSVLSALEQDINEDRYRLSPLLRQMAVSGEWWHSTKS